MRTVYTLLLYIIQPLIWLRLLWRSIKAPAYRKRWLERYGFCKNKVTPGGILLHSVSVGETIAAIPLIKALRQRHPDLPITVTTMTPTGSERVRTMLGDSVGHVYLPYDLPCAMHRFFSILRPKLVVVMETELWPNMIHYLDRKHIPLIIANARLSERSANGYKKLPGLTRSLMQEITLIAAQNNEDGQRFISLGLPPDRLAVTGSIKFDIHVTPELKEKSAQLKHQWAPSRPVWIAASTHDGEEAIIIQAYQALLNRFPNLLLILVPRHPERFVVAKQLTEQAKLSYISRSSGEEPSAATQVVIGDTMGELMLLYGVADLAFVGGSLIERGGHNPLEPASHGIPVLMGPHTFNFKDICRRLTEDGGLLTVNDADTLTNVIDKLLSDNAYRHQVGDAAIGTLLKNQGALDKLLALIEGNLPSAS
jgi:3-deoxy-D-manno-octulosonic-acid transferase